jgi:hypothetical protein
MRILIDLPLARLRRLRLLRFGSTRTRILRCMVPNAARFRRSVSYTPTESGPFCINDALALQVLNQRVLYREHFAVSPSAALVERRHSIR